MHILFVTETCRELVKGKEVLKNSIKSALFSRNWPLFPKYSKVKVGFLAWTLFGIISIFTTKTSKKQILHSASYCSSLSSLYAHTMLAVCPFVSGWIQSAVCRDQPTGPKPSAPPEWGSPPPPHLLAPNSSAATENWERPGCVCPHGLRQAEREARTGRSTQAELCTVGRLLQQVTNTH